MTSYSRGRKFSIWTIAAIGISFILNQKSLYTTPGFQLLLRPYRLKGHYTWTFTYGTKVRAEPLVFRDNSAIEMAPQKRF